MTCKLKDIPELSNAEWAVMKIVWDGGPMALGEIYERFSGEKRRAYSTVKTLVRRMVNKGWLTYRRVGNSFLYNATVQRQNAVQHAMREFLSRVLDGALIPFVAHYVEENELSEEDLAQLEELVNRHRKKGEK